MASSKVATGSEPSTALHPLSITPTPSSSSPSSSGTPSNPSTPTTLGHPPHRISGSAQNSHEVLHQNIEGSFPLSPEASSQDQVHDLPLELLQRGWRKFWSKRENRPYYFNKLTNESLWDPPQLGAVVSGHLF